MISVNVRGGTRAGWKRQKPAPQPWECRCVEGRTTLHYRLHPGWRLRCEDCGGHRDG